MTGKNEDISRNVKSCVVICGGQSRRMGQDKGSMIIHDKPMIKHILSTLNYEINDVVIVLNDQKRIGKYRQFIDSNDYSYKLTMTEDEIKNRGPLPGILTGLKHIESDYALVLPCDSPYITKNYINAIFEETDGKYEAIVPYHDDDNRLETSEPLHSVYNKNIIPEIEKSIKNDTLHIKGLIKNLNTKFVLIDNKKIEKKEFRNLNSSEDI